MAYCSAKNTPATTPSMTNRPTQKSFLDCCMVDFSLCRGRLRPRQILNIRAVRMKPSPSTANEATTTVRVVARETPSGVGLAV